MSALHRDTTQVTAREGARTRLLDTAEGVLIGIRRIDAGAAFDELVGAARRHGVSVFALAEALVALAGGTELPDNPTAARAARTEWGALFWP